MGGEGGQMQDSRAVRQAGAGRRGRQSCCALPAAPAEGSVLGSGGARRRLRLASLLTSVLSAAFSAIFLLRSRQREECFIPIRASQGVGASGLVFWFVFSKISKHWCAPKDREIKKKKIRKTAINQSALSFLRRPQECLSPLSIGSSSGTFKSSSFSPLLHLQRVLGVGRERRHTLFRLN